MTLRELFILMNGHRPAGKQAIGVDRQTLIAAFRSGNALATFDGANAPADVQLLSFV